jgi:hypothetical protein
MSPAKPHRFTSTPFAKVLPAGTIALLVVALLTLPSGSSAVARSTAPPPAPGPGFALATARAAGAIPLPARAPQSAQPIDEAYTAKILEDTTAPEFLTPLVEFLPAGNGVPTPLDFHGHIAGGRDHLNYAADIHAYMRALAEASPRVATFTMGMTEEGRERQLVVISDEGTIADLDHYKDLMARLADPRALHEPEASAVIAEAKPMYWALGGLHSGETGPPEMLMEMAYRLAVEERPFFQEIREGSIVLITPVVEVDGRERRVDTVRYWQRYPDREAPPLLYWGKYAAHDNNRDGIGLLLSLSTQTIEAFDEYHPVVMHDLHESVPFLYIMAGHGPYNPWLDPIVTEEWTEMAWHEVRQMNTWNVPGVWTFDFFDGWATNYMIYAALGRNAIGRFYETFGNGTPDTREREVGGQAARDWFRMNPPYSKVMWSLRNNTNLMQSALLTGMHNVAANKERFLRSFYTKGQRSVEKAQREGPAAWLIEAGEDADRPVLAARLVNLLLEHKIEIHRLDDPATIEAGFSPDDATKEMEFAPGTWVVRMDQPYSRLPDMLMDFQYYNPRDPSPYDDTGWTLGATFNVPTYRVTDTSILDVDMTRVTERVGGGGSVRTLGTGSDAAGAARGAGGTLLVKATGEPEIVSLRYKLADVAMRAAEEAFEVEGETFPAGTLLIDAAGGSNGGGATPGGGIRGRGITTHGGSAGEQTRAAAGSIRDRVAEAAAELGIPVVAVATAPEIPTHEVGVPRIALLHNWFNTQSEGWYRAMLDELQIPFDYISIHDARDIADLRARWDAIIMGPGFGNFLRILHGREGEGDHPIPWQTTELTPNIGVIDSTPDIRRGLGYEGLMHLVDFAERGGLLLTMMDSTSFAIDSGIVRHVSSSSAPADMQARGAIFNARVTDPSSPIAYGFDEDNGVYFSGGNLLQVSVQGGGFGGGRGGGGGARTSGRRGEDFVPGRTPEMGPPEVEAAGRGEGRGTGAGAGAGAGEEGGRGGGARAGEAAAAAEGEAEGGDREILEERYTNVDDLLREDDPRARASQPSPDVFPRIVMRFAARANELLLSGMLNNGAPLADRPAIIDAPVGDGHVVMFAINPMWRHQTWGQAALVLNAILHHDALDAGRDKLFQPTEDEER